MSEVKVQAVLLLGLLVAAYLSWTGGEEPATAGEVRIVDAKPGTLERIELVTRTQTIAVGLRDAQGGQRYPWFEVTAAGKTRGFTGSSDVDKLFAGFAPFIALRSLGKDLSGPELEEAGLARPERRLTLGFRGAPRTFELGGRTSGARDHYVRAAGGAEVFLVASRVLAELEFPEGRFMQRRLREAKLVEVERLVLEAGGRSLVALHRNRRSETDALWATEAAPDVKDETLGNFVQKLEQLTAADYPGPDDASTAEVPVLTARWRGEGDADLGTVVLARRGEGEAAEYRATSAATRVPVKVSRPMAEQLERDLAALLAR